MSDWRDFPITTRQDGSFVVTRDGFPCHVPDTGEWAGLYAQVSAYAAAHPGQVTPEAPPPPPTTEELIRRYTARVQRRLDDFARTKTYDSMLSACTYATSTDSVFAAEGQYCVSARDATWKAANVILNAVLTGERPVPAWEEIEAELPELAWPAGATGE